MPCATLQGGHDVLLISHGGHHHHACIRVLLHDLLGGFNAFHLRHGDIHEHNIRLQAVIFADGRQYISSFARDLAAKTFHDTAQIFAREDGVVHDQILDRLPVFAPLYCCTLLHTPSSNFASNLRSSGSTSAGTSKLSAVRRPSPFRRNPCRNGTVLELCSPWRRVPRRASHGHAR